MKQTRQSRVCASFLLLLAVGCGPALAVTYYTSVRCDDAADGLTSATAFASVAKGVSVLAPGDTLCILPGEYFEAVATAVSGTPEAPVTIRASMRLAAMLEASSRNTLTACLPRCSTTAIFLR